MRISDEQLDTALDIIHDRDGVAAQAMANRKHLEEYRKSLKAIVMSEYQLESLGAQERRAYSDQRYLDHLEVLKEAIKEDEKRRYLREGAAATIEIWRSQQANERKGQIV